MPTTGSYEFKLAAKAVNGIIADESEIAVGEWAWIDRTVDWTEDGVKHEKRHLLIYARDPDCKELCTLWRRLSGDQEHGHTIDAQGNISPSVLHHWPYGDPQQERCGFHTQPTRLLGFVDLR